MIRSEADRILVTGPMTMSAATALLSEGSVAVQEAAKPAVDLAGVTDMDSSCLAVLFGWMRLAAAGGKTLDILNPPQNLQNLAAVYGVVDLLPKH